MRRTEGMLRCLKTGDLKTLFVEELGWDRLDQDLRVTVDGVEYLLHARAHKRGVQVLEYVEASGEALPGYGVRQKIERQVKRHAYEHLIIFRDAANTIQVWQWVAREARKPDAYREHHYRPSVQAGESLVQKLENIRIPLDDEEAIDLGLTVHRLRDAFDRDKITKKFYDRFKQQHGAFVGLIEGIEQQEDCEWYSSLMLNRLMFVYFVQKKGFLDGNADYLRDRLERVRASRGQGSFLSFYRYFLRCLFHEGFAKRPESREMEAGLQDLLGTIPYLNGGLFELHKLEEDNPGIDIPDEAFERLFDFFDEYDWHLDVRPLRDDREINPDVLGYIFEKFINQKQMGAYYTKEDITRYIAENTIAHHLIGEAARRCAIAFEGGGSVWRLLREDPARYIRMSLCHGVLRDSDTGRELPEPKSVPNQVVEELAGGAADALLNSEAPSEYGLPGETWSDYLRRRERCLSLRQRLSSGEVTCADDLVSDNLDIVQFVQDLIEQSDGPELLRSLYSAISGRLLPNGSGTHGSGVRVLDPTCGSGAFLFAAVNVLQPLYEACLDRMSAFIQDSEGHEGQTDDSGIEGLIRAGESATVEFKSTVRWDLRRRQPSKDVEHAVVKTVAGMLNARGGTLLIGVSDSGEIVGLENDYRLFGRKHSPRDSLENYLSGLLFEKHLGRSASLHVGFRFEAVDGADVCQISMQPSSYPVFVKDGGSETLYVRTGNSTRSLGAREVIEYHKQRFVTQQVEVRPEVGAIGEARSPKYEDFREVLRETALHPSREYFILKSIMVNNLFGVDLMPEAVEICKLRLFLKLVAQIGEVGRLEPLPDIDFNIRVGNALVGFAQRDDIAASCAETLGFDQDEVGGLLRQAEYAQVLFDKFQRLQTDQSADETELSEVKARLRSAREGLADSLNDYMAAEYQIPSRHTRKLAQWKSSHMPFHWFVEFYGIMQGGGFDVIIGNPPYVEYRTVKDDYTVRGYETESCGDLYAYVMERSYRLLGQGGQLGMIVPISAFGVDKFEPLQDLTLEMMDRLWVSSYANRPAQLFEGAQKRLSIVIGRMGDQEPRLFTSRYYRWFASERPQLLSAMLEYAERDSVYEVFSASLEKLGCGTDVSAFGKLISSKNSLLECVQKLSANCVYYTRKFGYFLAFLDEVPVVEEIETGERTEPSELKILGLDSEEDVRVAVAVLSSSTFFWFWNVLSDCRNLNRRDVLAFPLSTRSIDSATRSTLAALGGEYLERLKATSRFMTKSGLRIETFDYASCKPIIDRIDRELAGLFGLSNEEFESVRNYDLKYRVGYTEA